MFPERLKEMRKEKKLTHEEMASILGITRQGYGHYESGKREPDQETTRRLADFFNTSIDFLHGRTDDPSPTSDEKKTSSTNAGRAFLGGADSYSEEELDLARAAAKAAVEAFRKAQKKKTD